MIDKSIRLPIGRTVGGLKQEATALKKLKGINHCEALNIVAENNGFPGGWHKVVEYCTEIKK